MHVISGVLEHRGVLALMIRQDLKNYYSRYRLGLLWTMAEPFLQALFMLIVLGLIFGGRGNTYEPFIVYLTTGLLPLSWLTSSVSGGPKTLRRYGSAMVTSRVPAVMWPMRIVLTAGADMVLAAPVVVAFAVGFHLFTGDPDLGVGVVLLPLALITQFLLGMGLAMIGAALAVRLPDIERMTSLLNRFFFWMSPVLWAQKDFPSWIKPWLYLNPFHAVLDFYRATFWPQALAPLSSYAISFAVIAVLFVTGALLLRTRLREMRRVL